jgi:hypothetical protein
MYFPLTNHESRITAPWTLDFGLWTLGFLFPSRTAIIDIVNPQLRRGREGDKLFVPLSPSHPFETEIDI